MDGFEPEVGPQKTIVSPFNRAIRWAGIQQVIVLVLAATILDGGHIVRICLIAALAHWGAILFIGVRRRGDADPARHGDRPIGILDFLRRGAPGRPARFPKHAQSLTEIR